MFFKGRLPKCGKIKVSIAIIGMLFDFFIKPFNG